MRGDELIEAVGADQLRRVGEKIGEERRDQIGREAGERAERRRVGLIEVVAARLRETCAPMAKQRDDELEPYEPEGQIPTRPFAGRGQPQTIAGEEMPADRRAARARILARREGGERQHAKADQEDVEHRDARLHEYHAIDERDRRRVESERDVGGERHRPQPHRRHRQRAEQQRHDAPAERIVAEQFDAPRDQHLGERRMLGMQQLRHQPAIAAPSARTRSRRNKRAGAADGAGATTRPARRGTPTTPTTGSGSARSAKRAHGARARRAKRRRS